ncbi:MAG: hypothetical protein P4N41_24685 [Negativicutes bacterium]|nr:hypothetical protein [Negativicutes bacterium]MDR3592868.1 hypothetical protein [Negativicutes bacterium]
MVKLIVTRSLSTAMTKEKVSQVADEAGVNLVHVETKMAGKGKWLNDFEVSGPPGRVDGFFSRIEDLRTD